MAVPRVGPVDSAIPYEANVMHESKVNDSHLMVEDNLSQIFEVDKRPALVTDLVSENNESSKLDNHLQLHLSLRGNLRMTKLPLNWKILSSHMGENSEQPYWSLLCIYKLKLI